jgi:hypothetical protein
VETCDYFLASKIGPTASNPSYTNVRTIYGLLVGKNYDNSTESGIDTGSVSSAINIQIQWTNNLVRIIHLKFLSCMIDGFKLVHQVLFCWLSKKNLCFCFDIKKKIK